MSPLIQVMLFDHVRDQWNLLSAMFGVWTEEEFLVTCKVLALLLLPTMIIMIIMAVWGNIVLEIIIVL